MAKYLDELGFAFVWAKIKEALGKKADAASVPKKLGELENDAGYITADDVPEGVAASPTVPKMDGAAAVGAEAAFARGDHVHPTDTSRLAATGDGSLVTASFNPAAAREAPASGETLSVLFGKLARIAADLGALAFRGTVTADDLDAGVQASLAKADSALQSFTEADPTVPAWAKAAAKPSYTAAEVGAIPASEADNFARKSDLTAVYRYKGSVGTFAELPTEGRQAGDVWDVEETDMNYGWTGEKWDPLGQPFRVESLSVAEIDAVMNA